MATHEEVEIQIPTFEPWIKYPDLTQERLSIIAAIIRDTRHDAVLSHEIEKGDTNWGLGCRVYERTCFALESAAPKYADWLIILPEARALQFSFAIGVISFRFYRGTPQEPPDKYRICTFGELHHQQLCFELEGLRPPDNVLRIAVETSHITLEVVNVSVVEVDDVGNPIGVYSVPLTKPQISNITVLQAKPVELEPPSIAPLTSIEKVRKSETNGTKEKIATADTGTE